MTATIHPEVTEQLMHSCRDIHFASRTSVHSVRNAVVSLSTVQIIVKGILRFEDLFFGHQYPHLPHASLQPEYNQCMQERKSVFKPHFILNS